MRGKTTLKLFLSLYIFCYLIFIIPIFIFNIIGYAGIGMFRISMLEAKLSDFLFFSLIAFGVIVFIVFVLWIGMRTIEKDGKYVRTFNGLDFDGSNIILVSKRRFGLLILATIELNNYRSIHHIFSNKKELEDFINYFSLGEDKVIDRTYKFKRTILGIRALVLSLLCVYIVREVVTTTKSFREKSFSMRYTYEGSLFVDSNSDYVVTTNFIYNRKTKDKIKYELKGGTLTEGEASIKTNNPLELSLYETYFVCKYDCWHFTQDEKGRRKYIGCQLVEEEIGYDGKHKQIRYQSNLLEGIDETTYFPNFFDPNTTYFHGDSSTSGAFDPDDKIRYEVLQFAKTKSYYKDDPRCIDGFMYNYNTDIYFFVNSSKKYFDDRYIGKSALYRYNLETKEFNEIVSFKNKKIIYYENDFLFYIDYKTVYRYDLNAKKSKKVCTLNKYTDAMFINYDKNHLQIYTNKYYLISYDGELVYKGGIK